MRVFPRTGSDLPRSGLRTAVVGGVAAVLVALGGPAALAAPTPTPTPTSGAPDTPAPTPAPASSPTASSDTSEAPTATTTPPEPTPTGTSTTVPSPAAAESTASAQAAATGTPVEVTDETTETTQVMANPDGTFTMTSNLQPVRVQQNGVWVPIDTTLHANPDGTLSPAATTEDITFSGGGNAPTVTLAEAGRSVSFSWPGPLPTPQVTGDTAVYPSVLPGVDLHLTAHANSYSEVLVITNATAAANPALAHLHLTATTTGLTLHLTDDGQLSAVDTEGTEVFHGSVPLVWDSTVSPELGPTPTATNPGSGQTSTVQVTAATAATPATDAQTSATTATDLTLTPDPAALTGPNVTYPVYFDPQMTGAKQHYATVTDMGWHYFDDPNETARVGFCNWTGCNGAWHARSYFQMNTTTITHRATTAQIYAADFGITQIHNANACTAQPVELFKAGGFNSGTVWGGPLGAGLQSVSANFGDSCPSSPANVVRFTNANVVAYVQAAANSDLTSLNFALKSPDEGNRLQWKQFATNPSLVVRYNFPPNIPTGLAVSHAISCNGVVYTPDAFPILSAVGTDNNPSPLQLNLWFEVLPPNGGARVALSSGIRINSGTRGSWTVNKPGGLGNAGWSFHVKAETLPSDAPHLTSPYSTAYQFTTRANPITQAPRVVSFDYPDSGYWGPPLASAPKFLVDTNGAPDIAGFSYTWAGSGTEPALKTTDCAYTKTFTNGGWVAAGGGQATITVPSTLAPGFHTLYVRSFDDAHNLSPESSAYTFYLAPNVGVATTRLEANNASQLTLGVPAGQTAGFTSETGDPTFLSDGSQEVFNGTAAGQSFTAAFTAPVEADYALGAKFIDGSDHGELTFTLDDSTVLAHSDTTPLDTYSNGTFSAFHRLGGIHLSAGKHTITFTVVDTNPASTGDRYHIGLDYLLVVPFNNVTAGSFSDAMNNHGFAVDGSTAADLDLSTTDNSLSTQTLAAAGYAPGSTITVNGATFTMPSANPTTGNDNVLAAGQTIPLAQQVKATAVGLLAVSTCGSSPAVHATLNYTDSSSTNPLFAPVPDWIGGPASAAAVVLPHWDNGSTIGSTSFQPKLYAIFLPADPTKTLASITLPYTGSTLLPDTCPPALHILAIAPRPVDAGWIGAWAATTEDAASPPGGAGLADQTLRTVVHPTVTGTQTRIRLSNTGATAVTIDDATLAAQSGTGASTTATPAQLSFCAATGQPAGCGAHTITLAAGAEAYSDPVAFPDTSTGSGNLVVSIHLPTAVTTAPVHTAGNTTNYLATGDATANQDGTPFTTSLTDSYYLTAVDVTTTDPNQGTIAILGDQTSAAGAPGGTYQPTWADDLPAKLGTALPGGLVNASLAGTQTTGWWRSAETGAALDRSVFDEPNLRTVIVALGAQDILQGVDPTTIEGNLTALMSDLNAYCMKNYQRPDGSFVHIVLATVPPLGLAPTDQREINRQQLNTAIRTSFVNLGADDVFDLDQAVRDSANPNAISPGYLTGGTPNAAYYDAVAQALADAVETFPPTAQL